MYLEFDSDEVTGIVGIRDAAAFFTHIPKLVPGQEWIIGIGCYEPDERFEAWSSSVGEVSVLEKFNFQRDFDLNSESYPRGRAFYLKATASNMERLAQLVIQSPSPNLFCDHVIGFEGDFPLFSFHDAFQGPDLLVSPTISKENIQAFCAALRVTFEKTKPPAFGRGFDDGVGSN